MVYVGTQHLLTATTHERAAVLTSFAGLVNKMPLHLQRTPREARHRPLLTEADAQRVFVSPEGVLFCPVAPGYSLEAEIEYVRA